MTNYNLSNVKHFSTTLVKPQPEIQARPAIPAREGKPAVSGHVIVTFQAESPLLVTELVSRLDYEVVEQSDYNVSFKAETAKEILDAFKSAKKMKYEETEEAETEETEEAEPEEAETEETVEDTEPEPEEAEPEENDEDTQVALLEELRELKTKKSIKEFMERNDVDFSILKSKMTIAQAKEAIENFIVPEETEETEEPEDSDWPESFD